MGKHLLGVIFGSIARFALILLGAVADIVGLLLREAS